MSKNDGRTHNEIERVYYGRLNEDTLADLAKASRKEKQEQWQVNAPNGKIRVRAVNDTEEFTMAIKKKPAENEFVITKETYESFKAISDNGMIKVRFEYPIDVEGMNPFNKAMWRDLKWEVDMFLLPDGKFAPWCKIDLEVKNNYQFSDEGRPKFPVRLAEVIVDRGEDAHRVKEIYEKYFIARK